LQFGILMASALPLVAVLQPLVPSFPALAFLALLVVAALVIVWRNANVLYGHARAGAEVILLALTQHDRAHASDPEVARTMTHLSQMLPGLGDPVLLRLTPHHAAVGHTLRELDLRGRTGAMILAIQRAHAEGPELIAPDGGVQLLAGDCVAVAGTPDAVHAASGLLCGPPAVLTN
jgi:CPA2 family monovalent cation:H+ antiporter-2